MWRDIPAQLTASDGERTVRRELSDRFQKAIDAAAMKAGLIGSDDYLEHWRRATRPCGDDLESEVASAAEELEASHPREVLLEIVRAGGVARAAGPGKAG